MDDSEFKTWRCQHHWHPHQLRHNAGTEIRKESLSEKGLEYRIVSIAFLPDEVERAEKVFAKVLEQATGDATWPLTSG